MQIELSSDLILSDRTEGVSGQRASTKKVVSGMKWRHGCDFYFSATAQKDFHTGEDRMESWWNNRGMVAMTCNRFCFLMMKRLGLQHRSHSRIVTAALSVSVGLHTTYEMVGVLKACLKGTWESQNL